jgi:hypothetical protein
MSDITKRYISRVLDRTSLTLFEAYGVRDGVRCCVCQESFSYPFGESRS